MKKYIWLLLIFGFLTISKSVSPPRYGGKIIILNISSLNLYIEFDIIEPNWISEKRLLLIEKDEQVIIDHVVYDWEEEKGNYFGDPNNNIKNITFYDLDNGKLISELNSIDIIFRKIYGSVQENDALFLFIIYDNILGDIL